MHRFLIVAVLGGLFFQSNSYATSRAREPAKNAKRAVSSAACEARARFIEPFYVNDVVYWKFEVQSTQSKSGTECPPVDQPLDVLVWGAQHISDRGGIFVYPHYIEEPEVNAWKQLRIEQRTIHDRSKSREYRGWMVTNWDDGIQPAP